MSQASAENSLSATEQTRQDEQACKALLKNGSRSFHAASFLLPKSVRDPAIVLYAFCRLADDAVDDGDGRPEVISALHDRLDALYAGQPYDHPVDRAFARTIRQFSLPRSAMDALIEGFSWDISGRRYSNFEEVLDYGARVAGCVGIMMTSLMGKREASVLARAADLGVAMQLTNIARDVGEDARNGRLYLPADWLQEAGIDPDHFLANPVFSPALGGVVQRLLDEADRLYARADAGIAMLPANCRPGIRAARLIYSAIGDAVRRQDYDSVSQRAFVPTSHKLKLMARTLSAAQVPSNLRSLPPLASTSFLVDALLQPGNVILQRPAIPWWDFKGRFMHVLSIFEKLKRHDREMIGQTTTRMA